MKLSYAAIALVLVVTPPKPITIYLAGDSTMAPKEAKARPETGWGERLQQYFEAFGNASPIVYRRATTSSFNSATTTNHPTKDPSATRRRPNIARI